MIVVDTNIIIYLYLEGEHSSLSEQLLEIDPEWAAPILWRSEFRNVLSLYLRKKIISYKDALSIITEAEKLMEDHEYTIHSNDVLELVKISDCSAYDCEFICLAQELSTLLVTEDNKILKNFPNKAISLKKFLAISSN